MARVGGCAVTLTVGRADDMGLDPTDGAWVTVCEEHGTIANSRTRALAAATTGTDFCDDCREAARG